MAQKILEEKEEGNTKSSSKVLRKRHRRYCFTVNNYTSKMMAQIIKDLSSSQYIIGEEVGEAGTPHLQGYVEFKNPIDFDKFKIIVPTGHIEKAKGNKKQNFIYCSKDEKFHTNITDVIIPKKIRDPMDGKIPHPWQKEILNIIKEEPNDRIIYWYWETVGGVGKSALCKHIVMKHNCLILNGKQSDMFNAILSWKESTGDFPEIIIIDIPRSTIDYVSWGGIEKIKDGLFYSGKYEGGMVVMNPPHIICMANSSPDESKLSADRWIINEIGS